MLVKPPHGFASVGLRKELRVTNVEDLKKQAAITMKAEGRVLIEEFIEGREFTCLIGENPDDPGPPASPSSPVEFIFPEGESFKHYNMKWVDYDKMNVVVVDNPAIEKRLRDYTTRIFVEFGIRGYARTDFRMGKDGELYMLEINPNCGIFYPPAEPGLGRFLADERPDRSPGLHGPDHPRGPEAPGRCAADRAAGVRQGRAGAARDHAGPDAALRQPSRAGQAHDLDRRFGQSTKHHDPPGHKCPGGFVIPEGWNGNWQNRTTAHRIQPARRSLSAPAEPHRRPTMPLPQVLEVAIGLILVYYILGALVSIATQAVLESLETRGVALERYLKILAGDMAIEIKNLPQIKALQPIRYGHWWNVFGAGTAPKKIERIPVETLVDAFFDLTGLTSQGSLNARELTDLIGKLPESDGKQALLGWVTQGVTALNDLRERTSAYFGGMLGQAAQTFRAKARSIVIIASVDGHAAVRDGHDPVGKAALGEREPESAGIATGGGADVAARGVGHGRRTADRPGGTLVQHRLVEEDRTAIGWDCR